MSYSCLQECLLKYSQCFYYFYTHIHTLFWARLTTLLPKPLNLRLKKYSELTYKVPLFLPSCQVISTDIKALGYLRNFQTLNFDRSKQETSAHRRKKNVSVVSRQISSTNPRHMFPVSQLWKMLLQERRELWENRAQPNHAFAHPETCSLLGVWSLRYNKVFYASEQKYTWFSHILALLFKDISNTRTVRVQNS